MTEIATFFNEYVLADYSTTQKHLTDIYIPALTLIAPIVTAILHTFIWIILKLRKKENGLRDKLLKKYQSCYFVNYFAVLYKKFFI